ncbi:MAG: ABC transporter permease [Nocardiaceae bacterium]|nr:ABC transporter permease [Nocardiaceae bacterium]
MLKVTLRNLAAHRLRLALTLLSVILGTAFVAGSFVFTDTLKTTFDSIFSNQAKGVDVRASGNGYGGAVSLDQIPQIQAVPGVAKVAPNVRGSIVLLDVNGKPVQSGGAPSFGLTYLPPEESIADERTFVEGHPPASGEVALNVGAAKIAQLKLGDDVRIVINSRDEPLTVKLTGLYSTPTDTGGFVGAVFEQQQAKDLFTDGQHVDYVDIAAAQGVGQAELRDRVAAAFPDLKVQTGDEVRDELKSSIFDALKFVNYFLLAFGGISLLVATFIIFNTFSMIVAQRLRELALLRAVGASRSQIRNSVAVEAAIVGVIGSAIGLAAGVGLAYGLRSALNAAGFALPTGTLELTARTIVLSLIVGVIVTILSAYAPARRASRVPPVEAMRAEFHEGHDGIRARELIAAPFAVLAIMVIVFGVFNGESTGTSVTLVGLGAALLVLCATLAAPALMKPLITVLGVSVKPFGAMGALGRRNAVRNPRRTAATASALTLGLLLVSIVSILGSSAKASINALIDDGVTADFVLSAATTGPGLSGIPVAAGDAAATVPGVASVVPLHMIVTSLTGANIFGVSTEADLNQAVKLHVLEGTDTPPADGLLISEERANGRKPGDIVVFANPTGDSIKATIAGVYERNTIVGGFVAGTDLYHQLTLSNKTADFFSFIKLAPGADEKAVRSGLEAATDRFYVVQVLDREQFKGTQAQQINTLLGILYGLLGLAVIIGILGIVNTLALSVVERRREIGMLRAVGMLRSQVRRIIYVEAVLIALAGAIIGVGLGVPLGAAFVKTLASEGLDKLAVPWSQVVLMLIASAIVGVLAALWPAIRAARTRPLEAIVDL